MRKDVRNEILMKGGEKMNKSETARKLGCSRQTIYNREKKLNEQENRKNRKYQSKLDDFKIIIEEKVDKNCSAYSIFKFIEKQRFEGKYGIVKQYVKEYKKDQVKKATIRFETIPGLQAQVDWKESMKLYNKQGILFEINIFLIILGYSRYKFIKLTDNRNQQTLFECMVSSFSYFSGCPKEILFDNMKTVVNKARTTLSAVVFNSKFMSFANDAGFTPLACIGYRPSTKGKVETVARLMNRLKVYDGEFETWEDLEKIVKEFLEELNSETVQGIGIIPKEVHKKEKEYLNTLPLWDKLLNYYSKEKTYKVTKESMINYKGKKYSVPTFLLGKEVTVTEIDSRIDIYYNMDFIESHIMTDEYFNYSKEDYKEILRSDAYKYKSDEELEEIVELKRKDRLLGVNIHE